MRGTVLRIGVYEPTGQPPVTVNTQRIGGGFAEQLNSSALVLGPTGEALGDHGTLYVADTVNSRIAAIPDAPFRVTLRSPVARRGPSGGVA